MSIYGSEDQVLDIAKYENLKRICLTICWKPLQPVSAGFGSYGAQEGDGIPTITNEEQISHMSEKIAD